MKKKVWPKIEFNPQVLKILEYVEYINFKSSVLLDMFSVARNNIEPQIFFLWVVIICNK